MSVEGVFDAIVVGVPHIRWGEKIVAVVQMAESNSLNKEEIRVAVAQKLSGYKVPKEVIQITDMARGPNGKANYKLIQDYAKDYLARTS
jgi:fatty-acyl-CoA synthase